jgi:thiol-disulfide isomerase/thioredoxin
MQILTEKLHAPELKVEGWINSPPLTLADLRGRIVLVDFWDYSCVNCLHTLPYLQEWHRRYAELGLTIIGIHAPEFDFAHAYERIKEAVQSFGIEYPVAQDNVFKTWNAFANRAWPAKYLIDDKSYIRAFHHGEGAYAEMEQQIQTLLLEIDPSLKFPAPMDPVRPIDQPGAACYRPTPELYLGYGRGEFGNREGNPPDQAVTYASPPDERMPHTVYLTGPWLNRKEFIDSVEPAPGLQTAVQHGVQDALIEVDYQAAQVNLVMGTDAETPITVQVLMDGQPVPEKDRGADMALVAGETVIQVDRYRMVQLLAHSDFERHRLTLRVSCAGLRAYAFTFVGCVV